MATLTFYKLDGEGYSVYLHLTMYYPFPCMWRVTYLAEPGEMGSSPRYDTFEDAVTEFDETCARLESQRLTSPGMSR